MLRELLIKNLAVVEQVTLHFNNHMTALTGETGAGKSILLDALSLALGERAETSLIRPGHDSAEVSALFELDHLPAVVAWLKDQSLLSEENPDNDCILRRLITTEGRSRAYINGRSVPLNQLRELGEQLVHIHGQHQHQALLKTEYQRSLLDRYADHSDLCEKVADAYETLEKIKKNLAELSSLQGQDDKLALLQYQIQEFEDLNLGENELKSLEEEHRKLNHAEQWIFLCNQALQALKPDEFSISEKQENNTSALLHHALSHILNLKKQFPELSAPDMIQNALIQIEEAAQELQSFKNSIQLDPERLQAVDDRLNRIHGLARKHKIRPEDIITQQKFLQDHLAKITNAQETLQKLSEELKSAETSYFKCANRLSEQRQKAAGKLSQLITNTIHGLEMPHGQFDIHFSKKTDSSSSPHGIDEIEFLATTNPGLPKGPLRKIASGGELSRISLAIQVITAQKMVTPTLIFDEVDVGVSGKTAEILGKNLRKLGDNTQVFCVTHLPQVAAQAHHHFKVEKQQQKESTTTKLSVLDTEGKIQEIARLLGGIQITKNTLAHAKEMLEAVS